jgi:nucleotide-binding universal stress UspA family protein
VKRNDLVSQTKKILLPVDGSCVSLKAARYALRMARLFDADITCIHVIEFPPLPKGTNPALLALYFSRAERYAKKWIRDVKQLSQKEKVRMRSEIMIGVPAPTTIIEYAKKKHIDLIVMGTRGRTGIRKLLLGSVAGAVLAHAGCPVLLVR